MIQGCKIIWKPYFSPFPLKNVCNSLSLVVATVLRIVLPFGAWSEDGIHQWRIMKDNKLDAHSSSLHLDAIGYFIISVYDKRKRSP
jgi:hypothetical protein